MAIYNASRHERCLHRDDIISAVTCNLQGGNCIEINVQYHLIDRVVTPPTTRPGSDLWQSTSKEAETFVVPCTWIAPPHHVIVMSVLGQSDDIEKEHFYGD